MFKFGEVDREVLLKRTLVFQSEANLERTLESMSAREAVIQAHIELGKSREEAELRAKCSDGFLPGAGALTQSPVRPGMEREFIEFLKQLFREMDSNPDVWQAMLRGEMGKRAKRN